MTRGKEVFFVLKRTMQSVFRVGSKHSSMKQQKTRSERAYGSNRGTHITKQTKDLHLMPVEKKKNECTNSRCVRNTNQRHRNAWSEAQIKQHHTAQ